MDYNKGALYAEGDLSESGHGISDFDLGGSDLQSGGEGHLGPSAGDRAAGRLGSPVDFRHRAVYLPA